MFPGQSRPLSVFIYPADDQCVRHTYQPPRRVTMAPMCCRFSRVEQKKRVSPASRPLFMSVFSLAFIYLRSTCPTRGQIVTLVRFNLVS